MNVTISRGSQTPAGLLENTPDILDEMLEESLERELGEALASGTMEDADPLEALLSESLTITKELAEIKAARERKKRGGQSASEAQADAERIKAWELKNEWLPVANVALFERHSCQCGKHSTVFVQYMLRQKHRHLRDSQRWQQTDVLHLDLPNEVAVQKWETPICPACAASQGFEFKNIIEWE